MSQIFFLSYNYKREDVKTKFNLFCTNYTKKYFCSND